MEGKQNPVLIFSISLPKQNPLTTLSPLLIRQDFTYTDGGTKVTACCCQRDFAAFFLLPLPLLSLLLLVLLVIKINLSCPHPHTASRAL